ncbi:FAST kinase domain-containing protein 5, mitochondrial-like isoform X1 [Octopus sinensis]|uniref:FAST kinase domain-containing protein 5, mitochondrial-like isoform X1 n=2 Tax=Octopus sinensis TaxID=2607531 RepID=A0A7E6F1S4_9MOLL|nr:FAST kinase domain-containing protein 5, mitochondrial-like isoform X1 [Octopus sinensis]
MTPWILISKNMILLKTICQKCSKRVSLQFLGLLYKSSSVSTLCFKEFQNQLKKSVGFQISSLHQYLPFYQNQNNLVQGKNQKVQFLKKSYSSLQEDKYTPVFQRQETENEHFYNYLSHNQEYQSFFLPRVYIKHCSQNQATDLNDFLHNFQTYSPTQILDKFHDLSKFSAEKRHKLFTNEIFLEICRLLIDQLPKWNTEQLFHYMNIIIHLEFRSSSTKQQQKIGVQMAKVIDDQCVLRSKDFTLKQFFQANDFFFLLYYYRACKFKHTFFGIIEDRLLNKHEIVLSLFYANLARKMPLEITVQILQCLPSISESLSIEETAIICLGFFKTKKQIRNSDFLEASAKKLNESLAQADSLTVASIFKGFQISCSKAVDRTMLPLFNELDALINPISKHLHQYTYSTFMHIILFFHNIHFVSDEFLANVKNRLNFEEFFKYRLKDITKICFSVANLEPVLGPVPEFWDKILQELESGKRKNEILQHPQCLLNILVAMTFLDLYPFQLIDFIFQPKMLEQIHDLRKTQRLDLRRELFHLSESVKLERPNYTGPLLPDNFLSTLSRNHEVFCKLPDLKSPDLSHRESLLLKFLRQLDTLINDNEKYQIVCFLPHFQTADIEMQIGHDGKLLPLNQRVLNGFNSVNKNNDRNKTTTALNSLLLQMVGSSSSVQRVALLVLGPNAFCRFHSNNEVSYVLTGLHKARIRQLKKKGFKVIEVPFFEICEGKDKVYRKLTTAFSELTH